MVAPSNRLLSKLIRRSPPPPLCGCLSTFTSSSSPSSHHFVPRHQLNHVCGPQLRPRSDLLPPHICFSFCRRFSTQPEEPLLPIRALISLLDGYHDHTGLPWWIIISSSTLAMRVLLFPFLVLQLKKLKRIGEVLPKLPPPLPPPLSRRSFKDQITFFWKEKQAAGCPSFFWFFASFSVQVPCFVLWIMSIRRMSLEHHSGFNCGGTLWFQNLTEYPNGVLGPIFPLLIAGLHYSNVQITIQKSSFQELPGTLGSLAKGYEFYLQLLTLPILFITFNVPQGSLVYWFTNSSLTLIQEMARTRQTARKRVPIAIVGEAFQLEYPRPHNRAHAALRLKELTIENQDRIIRRLRASNLERRKQVESLTSRLTLAERKIDDVCQMFEFTKDHNYGLRESLDTAMEQTRRAKEDTDQRKQELTEAKRARLEDGRKIDEAWTAILRLTEGNQKLTEKVDQGKEKKKKKLLEKHAECHTEHKNRLNETIAALHTRDSEIIDLKFEKQNLQWQIEDMMEPEEPEEDPEEEEAPPDAAIGNGEIE